MASSISTSLADQVERLTSEGLISMKDAAKLYGRKTHKSTVTRHALNGVRLPSGGIVKLEAIRVAGSLCTSRAAVLRFIERQQAPETQPVDPAPTPAQRNREADAAAKKSSTIFGA